MDLYKNYVKQIQRYPLLTFQEETDLADKAADGSKAAVSKLVNSNLRLVVSVARKFSNSKIPIMDLIQEGNLGLMAAASKYRASYKTRFSTYAYAWIMQYMLRYIHNKCAIIALPYRKNELIRSAVAAQNHIFQQTGHTPTEKEISDYLGISENNLKKIMSYLYSISSLDNECGDGSNSTIADLIEDETFSPEVGLMKEVREKQIMHLISRIPEKEQTVIYHRFNLSGEKKPKTLREISKMLGVSTETVRQMEIRAINRLKKTAYEEAKSIIS